MRIERRIDLEKEKAHARRLIDEAAEATRLLFITPGSGQSMVYGQKFREAEYYLANPNISVGEIPHLHDEATLYGIDLLTMASIVISKAHEWNQVSADIETTRLAAKMAVDNATDYKVIRSIPNEVDWDGLVQELISNQAV